MDRLNRLLALVRQLDTSDVWFLLMWARELSCARRVWVVQPQPFSALVVVGESASAV